MGRYRSRVPDCDGKSLAGYQMLSLKYPSNMAAPQGEALTRDAPKDELPILFSTINPDVKNTDRKMQGYEQHATPSWNRLTSGDKQAGKMRGENSTKEARKECKE
jgi:hypothetical protein